MFNSVKFVAVVAITSVIMTLFTAGRVAQASAQSEKLDSSAQSVMVPAASASDGKPSDVSNTIINPPESNSTTTTTSTVIDPPPPGSGADYKVVLARVGNETIFVSDFMKYMTQDTRLVLKSKTAEGRATLLRDMIIDRLLEEGMRQENLLPRGQSVDTKTYLDAYKNLATRYFPKPEIPAEEVLYKYYEQHPDFYGIPAMVRIGQIQFQVPENADENVKAAAKTKANDAFKRLRAGESFAIVAEALTDNPQGKLTKGDLGFFQPEKDEWLKKAVTGLAIGQFSEPLESPVGYEIILLQDKRDAMIAPYVNVRDNVIARIQQEAQSKAREDYAWSVAKKIGVSIEKPALKSAIPASVAAEIKAPELSENTTSEANTSSASAKPEGK